MSSIKGHKKSTNGENITLKSVFKKLHSTSTISHIWLVSPQSCTAGCKLHVGHFGFFGIPLRLEWPRPIVVVREKKAPQRCKRWPTLMSSVYSNSTSSFFLLLVNNCSPLRKRNGLFCLSVRLSGSSFSRQKLSDFEPGFVITSVTWWMLPCMQ